MENVLSKRRVVIPVGKRYVSIMEMPGALLEELIYRLSCSENNDNSVSAGKAENAVIKAAEKAAGLTGELLIVVDDAWKILEIQARLNDMDLLTGQGSDWVKRWIPHCIKLGIKFGKTPQEIWETLSPRQIALMSMWFDREEYGEADNGSGIDGETSVDLRKVKTVDGWRKAASTMPAFTRAVNETKTKGEIDV